MKIIYKSPPKDTPKALIGTAATLALGAVQLYQGSQQKKRAREEAAKLEQNRPEITVPIELRTRAAEPIKREFIAAQEDAQGRRVSQSLSALEKGGSRTLLGGMTGVLDRDRQETVQRNAAYEQARVDASRDLGFAERDVQMRKENRWQGQAAATAAELNAGNQNVWGGANTIGSGVVGLAGDLQAMNNPTGTTGAPGTPTNPYYKRATSEINRQYGIYPDYSNYAKSGAITDGKFDHKSNPLYLVDKEGNVKLEATGQETILNPEQSEKVARESPEFRKLQKKFKTKAHKKRQLQKVS